MYWKSISVMRNQTTRKCVCVCVVGVLDFQNWQKQKVIWLQSLSFNIFQDQLNIFWFHAKNSALSDFLPKILGRGQNIVPLYPDSYARDDIVLDVKVIISIACVLSRQLKWESVFLLVLLYCRCSQYSVSYTDHKMGHFEEECAIKFMAIQVYYKHI